MRVFWPHPDPDPPPNPQTPQRFGNAAESAQPQRRCEGWWQRFPGLQEAWDRRRKGGNKKIGEEIFLELLQGFALET